MSAPTTAAVVGCGDVSPVHLDAIAALAGIELVAVCDTDPAARAAAAERHDVAGFADHRTLLARTAPDVVHGHFWMSGLAALQAKLTALDHKTAELEVRWLELSELLA